MSELLPIGGALLLGGLLGALFFWGLWTTLDGLADAPRPALRLLASSMLRLGATLAVFYLLARHGGWPQLLAAAAGFTLARLPIVRRVAQRRVQGRSAP